MPSDRPAMVRAFFALRPPDSVRRELCAAISAMRPEPWARGVRWVQDANIHLTVRFLGDVDIATVANLVARAAECSRRLHIFELDLDRLELFPNARRPAAVAARLHAEAGLTALAEVLEETAVAFGLPAEVRAFRPHITLGRVRGRLASRPNELPALRTTVFIAREVVLYRSVLGTGPAAYSELGRVGIGR